MDTAELVSRLLDVIEQDIAPMTRLGVAKVTSSLAPRSSERAIFLW